MPTLRSLRGRAFTELALLSDPYGRKLIDRVTREKLTFLSPRALLDLRQLVREMDELSVPGSVIEAGCALGGSAIVIAASKSNDRPMTVHDVFGMIPKPGEHDGADVHERYEKIVAGAAEGFDGDTYYGYEKNLKDKVADSFARLDVDLITSNVSLVEGLFEDTIWPDGPVALAHVDGDWYKSVKVCLERIWPHLSRGGVIVIDDYDDWSGCRTAVDEFIRDTPEVLMQRKSRVHLRKSS